MITLSTSGSSIVFEFSGNSTYLNDGTITVPQNSLALIVDESDMISFKKANSNDLFVSANISEFGMTKDELISWYETNMVGSTGGGGVTSGDVQSMIDASVADYFDGVEYDSGTTRINFYHGNTVKAYIDASDFVIDGMIDDVRIETISGTSYLVIDFNTESGKEDIQIPLTDIFNPDNYYTKSETSGATEIATAIDEKANKSSAVGSYEFGAINQVNCIRFKMVSGPQILNDIYYPKINGKGILTSNNTWAKNNYDFQLVESTAVTTSVTSASTDSQVPSAKAVYDALGSAGGGVTTGEVQTMIDESISGKTDDSAFTAHTADTSIHLTTGDVQTQIDNSISGKVDTTTYTAYTAATDTVLSNKQTTLTAGTGIDITDNVISATGGGGKAIEAGTNISVTTGETADTINCTLNLENGTNGQSGGLKMKSPVAANEVSGRDACAFGESNKVSGINAFVCGNRNTGNTNTVFISGIMHKSTNSCETLFGYLSVSNGSVTVDPTGDSGATLFAVGNGHVSYQMRHNAFEIRQNGDIYIADTNDTSTSNYWEKPMVKLQDHLGGGGGFDTDTERLLSTALVDLNDRKADKTLLSGYQKKGDYATKSQLDAKANASEVMTLDKSKENELITAAALNSINERLIALETAVQTLQTLHNNE